MLDINSTEKTERLKLLTELSTRLSEGVESTGFKKAFSAFLQFEIAAEEEAIALNAERSGESDYYENEGEFDDDDRPDIERP